MPDEIVLRFLMVLGGMAPLFILWGIRGTDLMPCWAFWAICGSVVVIPNAVLWLRVTKARGQKFGALLEIGSFEDRREGILIYLVSILLPFYSSSLEEWSELIASVVAVVFILGVFIYLDLHYVNVFFALGGFKIYFVRPLEPESGLSSRQGAILVSKLGGLRNNDRLSATRNVS